MDEWDMYEKFIGHVREPVVSDYLFIARDLELTSQTIIGRNWLGLSKTPKGIKTLARPFDKFLQCFPSLCSDIYLIGTKAITLKSFE